MLVHVTAIYRVYKYASECTCSNPFSLLYTFLFYKISELFVDISVSYTPPPGFIPGPNEYRAASGPVTVTCTAVGGTGPVSYQWTSNCRDCSFQTETSSSVHRAAVHSGDTGIHTCTATTASDTHGNRSISFNVVGKPRNTT